MVDKPKLSERVREMASFTRERANLSFNTGDQGSAILWLEEAKTMDEAADFIAAAELANAEPSDV